MHVKKADAPKQKTSQIGKRKLLRRKKLSLRGEAAAQAEAPKQSSENAEARRARRRNLYAQMVDSPLHPDKFYRLKLGPQFFGYAMARMHDAINKGEIPTPIALSDTGRARGWFGRQIIEWQRRREEAALTKTRTAQ
jgi:predicted DNA-binding transcriptional regulator AlpA